MEPFLHVVFHTIECLELVTEFVTVECSDHEEFLLKLADIKCFHLEKHSFHGFEAQILDNRRYLGEMVLNALLA